MREDLVDRLRRIELFAELDAEQLHWLAAVGEPVTLADGELLFEDGQLAEYFYVLFTGELLITKTYGDRVEVLARHSADPARAVSRPGAEPDKPSAAHQFTGELPMLAGGGYVARGAAVGRTELLRYDRDTFLEMIVRCPQVCRVMLPVLAWRIKSYEVQASRRAMLDGLGTLAAGLAHELNNPAAAVVRAATELRESVTELAAAAVGWGRLATEEESAQLADVTARVRARATVPDPFDAVDAADEISDLLADHAVPRADLLATVLAENGVAAAEIGELADRVRACALPAAIGSLAYSLQADALVSDIGEASGRIAMLVRDTKSYTNLDRAPERAVDLTEGIDATLAMHATKLTGVKVCRSYSADVPPVSAYPSELNQVWSNLIDNAIDAMNGRGVLRVTTRLEDGYAVVEIGDDGSGVPADAIDQLFQPFFTTKDIGKGTGLGLHLSHGIVTVRHRGTISVCSVPGDTRFTVRLPAV